MQPVPTDPQNNVREFFWRLWRRKWIIAFVALLATGAALVSSASQPRMYEGVAELLLQPGGGGSLLDERANSNPASPGVVETEIRVLSSPPVRDRVRALIGSAGPVSASQVGATQVVRVRARSRLPQLAAATANAYAEAYIDHRRTQAVESLLDAAGKVQEKIKEIQVQLAELNAKIPVLAAGQVPGPADQQLIEQRNSLLSQQIAYKERLDRAQLDASLRSGAGQVVTPAPVPTDPVEPKPVRSGVLGGVLGLVLGVAFALLVDHFDDRIRSRRDVERSIGGMAVLGLIPAVRHRKSRRRPVLFEEGTAASSASEAFRSLRTALRFISIDSGVTTLQVTSPDPRDGKTTVVANLALALAGAGHRVIAVSCDLRRGRLHEVFGLTNDTGFTSVVLGDATLEGALHEVPGCPKLRVLASGPAPPNPSEILSSARAGALFAAAERMADVVLVDSPPVLPVTDAAVLSTRLGATLLVVRAGSTTRRELATAVEILGQVDANVVGTVVNGVKKKGGYGYPYRYQYGSTYTDAQKRRWGRRRRAVVPAVEAERWFEALGPVVVPAPKRRSRVGAGAGATVDGAETPTEPPTKARRRGGTNGSSPPATTDDGAETLAKPPRKARRRATTNGSSPPATTGDGAGTPSEPPTEATGRDTTNGSSAQATTDDR